MRRVGALTSATKHQAQTAQCEKNRASGLGHQKELIDVAIAQGPIVDTEVVEGPIELRLRVVEALAAQAYDVGRCV